MCWDQKRRVRTTAICDQISLSTLISRLTEQLIDHSMLERLLEEICTLQIKKKNKTHNLFLVVILEMLIL